MKKTVLSALAFVAFLFIPYSGAYCFSVSYDQTVKLENNLVAEVKVVVKDDFMRAESKFGDAVSVMYRNETGIYSYLPAEKVATKIPAAMDTPNLTRDLPNFTDYLQRNAGVKTGSEVLNGLQCDIYEFNEPTIQKKSKAWIWTEKSFPVKIEVPAPEGLTTVELSNIQFDPIVEASVFQLPAEAEVIDFNNLPSQSAKAAEDAEPAPGA